MVAGIERSGTRLSVSQQLKFSGLTGKLGSDHQAISFRHLPLAIEVGIQGGKLAKAASVFSDGRLNLNSPILLGTDTTLKIFTPSGHPLNIERLHGMTAAEIDTAGAAYDTEIAGISSRVPAKPAITPIFVPLKDKTFSIGSDDIEWAKPVCPVTFDHDIEVAEFPVTVSDYAAYVVAKRAEGVTVNVHPRLQTYMNDLATYGKRPVNFVSQEDAIGYAEWYGDGWRLSEEMEWEAAARGVEGRQYPWGNEQPTNEHANFGGESLQDVGTHAKGKTPEGVQDMAGGLWEWTVNQWTNSHSDADRANPSSSIVVRGGSFDVGASSLHAADRNISEPSDRNDDFGFRLFRTK